MTTPPAKCALCGASNPVNKCGLCDNPVCKNCTEFLAGDRFSFMDDVPKDLTHRTYCLVCFSSKVEPAISNYEKLMARARGVFIVDTPRRRPLPILEVSKETLQVEACQDKEETLMRLAFKAAARGFNAVIKAKISYKKVRNAGYQKMEWQGTGFPARLDAEKYERESD